MLPIRWILLIIQTVAVLWTSTLEAQTAVRDAEFQAYVDAGLAAYQAGRYGEAREAFARAHDARPSARTFRVLGITDFALDAFSAAHRELSAALTDPREPIPSEQRQEVEGLLSWMHSKLANVQLARTPRNAEVFIDDARADEDEVWMHPGEHRIVAIASGHKAHARTIHLRAGAEPQPLALVLVPEPSNVANSNTWLWIGGASLLAIAAGGTMFGLGRLEIDSVEQPGPPFRQLSQAEAEQQRGQWLTGLGIGVGCAGLLGVATAVVLGLRKEHPNRRPDALTVNIGPGRLALQGSF